MKRRKAYSREERLQQIVGVFLDFYQRGFKDATATEIARSLDLEPSTKFRVMLEHLVKQNVLVCATEAHASINGYRKIYRISPDYIEYAKAPVSQQKRGRELRINTRKGSFVEARR